jgi:hypothetical protein
LPIEAQTGAEAHENDRTSTTQHLIEVSRYAEFLDFCTAAADETIDVTGWLWTSLIEDVLSKTKKA